MSTPPERRLSEVARPGRLLRGRLWLGPLLLRRLLRISRRGWLLVGAMLAVASFISPIGVSAAADDQNGDDDDDDDPIVPPKDIAIDAHPVFGDGSLPPGGWAEIVVRIGNEGADPYRGRVTVSGADPSSSPEHATRTEATFSAGAGSRVSIRLPVRVADTGAPEVNVVDDDGRKVYVRSFSPAYHDDALLVDVARASALGAALRGASVGSRFSAWGDGFAYGGSRGGSGGPDPLIQVTSPAYDEVTGDPLLPRHAAGYARVSAVVMRSDELVRLPPAELEALAAYLLAGGTLGVVITRPEDLRAPVVVSLCGDALRELDAVAATTAPVVRPVARVSGPGAAGPNGVVLPAAPSPGPTIEGHLKSYEGGNVVPSRYGGSGAYGLGQVHVLGFDPQTRPAVDAPWVHLRMADLLRRADERKAGALFRPGEPHQRAAQIRAQLDPNESARWAILAATMLLLAYAILAGPANFTFWRRRGKPLLALGWMGALSAATFGAVLLIGVLAKGCSGEARHLTMIEAGAGMETGTSRRWRGFFVPSAQALTVTATTLSGVVSAEDTGSLYDDLEQELALDRDGLRLRDVALRPWETLVVREDGLADLGGGIAILGHAERVDVINRTEHDLTGLVLFLPMQGSGTEETRYLERLEAGGRVDSAAMKQVKRVVMKVTSTGPLGSLDLLGFDVVRIIPRLERAAPGLHDSWMAVSDAVAGNRDWFPQDVPVLLAAWDDEGAVSTDSGLGVASDRTLVRIVGWGGDP
ncbi:MAG: hypothetical protein AAF928_10535 [Myxococcota bacterium]